MSDAPDRLAVLLGVIYAMTDRAPQVQRTIELLDGRWTPPILAELARGGCRYRTSTMLWAATPTRC
jgi:DNA-binding HxlR family transcriptional regulator